MLIDKLRRASLGQAGDTIVEVLISSAIVSLVLVSCYLVVSAGYKNTEYTSEHAEAIKLVETQIEDMRAKPGNINNNGCFYINSSSQVLPSNGSGDDASDPVCNFLSDGNLDTNNTVPEYTLAITQSPTNLAPSGWPAGSTLYTYTITATWQSPTGTGNVSMEYRIQ